MESTAGKTFVVIPKQQNNPFFDWSREGCEYQAGQLAKQLAEPIACDYIGPVDPDPLEQIEVVRQVMAREPRVDGIAISVINADVVTPVLVEAREAGIPVVTFDSDSLEPGRETYIGTDNWAMGQTLAKILQTLQATGGTYGLVSDTAPNLAERERGFREYMANHEWIETDLSPLYTADDIGISLDRMEQFAALQPNIQAIVPVGGWPMFDSNQTRWRNFVDNNPDLTLVVADTLPVQVDLLMSGYVDGLVGQVPREMGVEAINSLYNLATGQPVNSTITLTFLMEMVRVPLILPPLNVDENYIEGLRFIGISLFAIIAFSAVFCIVWTWMKRKIRVVKASQPLFLIMIATGTLILGSALVPLSFDDSDPEMLEGRGDKLCMSVPWVACVGFAIAFSALFAKTWRINRIFHSRRTAYSRITVKERDVMIPLVVIVGVNVIILLCWQLIAPLKYVREAHEGTDEWNRQISFYGACRSEKSSAPYLVSLGLIDIGLLAVANLQAYQARSIQSEFAESKYIAIAMISLLQAGITGLPILFVVRELPRAFYLILVFMIFIICIAILLLIFVPKIIYERAYQNQSASQRNAAFRAAVQGSRPANQPSRFATSGGGSWTWSAKLRRQQKAEDDKKASVNGTSGDNDQEAPTARGSVTISCTRDEMADAVEGAEESTSGTGMRILRVDDEPIIIPMGRESVHMTTDVQAAAAAVQDANEEDGSQQSDREMIDKQ